MGTRLIRSPEIMHEVFFILNILFVCRSCFRYTKVNVSYDQEMVQSEENSHSKTRAEKKKKQLNLQLSTNTNYFNAWMNE